MDSNPRTGMNFSRPYCLLLIAYFLLLIAYCLLLIAYCFLLFAFCLLLIAYRILHIEYCLLLIAYCLLLKYCSLLGRSIPYSCSSNFLYAVTGKFTDFSRVCYSEHIYS